MTVPLTDRMRCTPILPVKASFTIDTMFTFDDHFNGHGDGNIKCKKASRDMSLLVHHFSWTVCPLFKRTGSKILPKKFTTISSKQLPSFTVIWKRIWISNVNVFDSVCFARVTFYSFYYQQQPNPTPSPSHSWATCTFFFLSQRFLKYLKISTRLQCNQVCIKFMGSLPQHASSEYIIVHSLRSSMRIIMQGSVHTCNSV